MSMSASEYWKNARAEMRQEDGSLSQEDILILCECIDIPGPECSQVDLIAVYLTNAGLVNKQVLNIEEAYGRFTGDKARKIAQHFRDFAQDEGKPL